jgi:GrpB-like predicted nucleotidyltransferase (UPF0157 family)
MVQLRAAEDCQPELLLRHRRVAARLTQRWPGLRVEPIGASALPGAWSKADLDVLALVPLHELEAAREVLVACGYVEKTGTLRTPALCMLEWQGAADAHAVQLVAAGSVHEATFLGFRDRLRAEPELVEAYNAVKQAAAALSDPEYRARKQRFIEAVLAGADAATAAKAGH